MVDCQQRLSFSHYKLELPLLISFEAGMPCQHECDFLQSLNIEQKISINQSSKTKRQFITVKSCEIS